MHVCMCVSVCVSMSLRVLRVSVSVWRYIINIRISMPEAGCHDGTCFGFFVHLCTAPSVSLGGLRLKWGIGLPCLHLQYKWVRSQPDL